jgi:proteasome assembly chaperone (PAC2) family protein
VIDPKFPSEDLPELTDPLVVVAFEGWNDAGDAATGAVEHLELIWDAKPLAALDPEDYYDFQVNRPTVSLVGGVSRRIEWPTTRISVARPPGADRDVVLVRGIEPNMRWRGFCQELIEILGELDVSIVVALGALLADTPHTRPTPVTGSAYDAESARAFGLETSRYEGPTGILGVLSDAAGRLGIPAVGLWAALPHYLHLAPNPWGAMALVEELGRLLPITVDTGELAGQTEAFDTAVTDLIDENPELAGYIERLETDTDEDDAPGLADLPPEQFVAEVERYLRDHPGGSRG